MQGAGLLFPCKLTHSFLGALSQDPTGEVVTFRREVTYDPTGRITPLGRIFAALPVDIRIARLIVFGFAFGMSYEALIMAACLSASGTGVFARPFQKDFEHFQRKLRWASDSSSDVIAAMRAFETWQHLRAVKQLDGRSEREWIRREFLNPQKYVLE